MYIERKTLLQSLGSLMASFPVVVIIGARQTGKTTLLTALSPQRGSFFDLDHPGDIDRVRQDPDLLFQEENPPYIFDEAQVLPDLFRAIRVQVDKNRRQTGQFLLSGSSSPALLSNISETLAGRVAIVELSPFEWSERHGREQSLFYKNIGSLEALLSLKPLHSHKEILQYCLYGGYPEVYIKRDDPSFTNIWFQNYIKTYIERDIRALFPNLKLEAYKRFVSMLSYCSGEIINTSRLANSLNVSGPTVKHYLDIIEGTFLWRKVLPFTKSKAMRVAKMPKGYLRDTGLINHLLHIHSVDNLKGHPSYGHIWESFIIEQIHRGFENSLTQGEMSFYRTNNKTEIDLIIEGEMGIIPIEIKSASWVSAKKLGALIRFIHDHHCPFGIVVNSGDKIFKIHEKVLQVPAIFL